MVVPSTPASKLARPTPFTPSRPLSSMSSSSSTASTVPATPVHKRYKAPISTESRSRSTRPGLAPIPATPTKKERSQSRPRTPGTPRRAESPSLMRASEMDVSNVDVEEVLVDYQSVEPGDVSAEMDEASLRAMQLDQGRDDKVMVSIRVRPSDSPSAWIASPSARTIRPLDAKAPPFNFDAVLTGTPNKPVYTTVARSHVHAAMDGYNAVVFAYGQTASGKTYTLTGSPEEPGIIPRAMKDVFGFIRRTPAREYLLRCSYLEIYNEAIHDLLAPPGSAQANPVQIQGGVGSEVILTPLREEVVTSLKGVKDVLRRGEGNRRTACTDWNERSSRSHSVFRLVVESRERDDDGRQTPAPTNGRHTPGNGRQTPGNGRHTPGPGAGPRLQTKGGKSVQTSVLSLIDLAGSEKATSDKERTREGKYINTSLLTLGTVIGTLADNAAKGKSDHVPYRNSKLTRMLQPSLAGNARISVICTINPDMNAVAESTSTLGFAKRIKNVQLNAQKKEVIDTDALIERYRKEIEDLKTRLAEREKEADAPPVVGKRRLSVKEQVDESKAMKDLNNRIKQLTKLILTSQSVDESKGDESRPGSPSKVDFDMSPYQLQQELLAARLQLESQATQILSLEAALLERPPIPATAPASEKDALIAAQAKTIRELEIAIAGYEGSLGEPLRKVREDVEREWEGKVEEEKKAREEGERWVREVERELEREKKARVKLEEERRALAAFVSKFDSLGLGLLGTPPASPAASRLQPPMPSKGGASAAFAYRQQQHHKLFPSSLNGSSMSGSPIKEESADVGDSPLRIGMDMGSGAFKSQPSLLEQMLPEEGDGWADASFGDGDMVQMGLEEELAREMAAEMQGAKTNPAPGPGSGVAGKVFGVRKGAQSPVREVLVGKENVPLC